MAFIKSELNKLCNLEMAFVQKTSLTVPLQGNRSIFSDMDFILCLIKGRQMEWRHHENTPAQERFAKVEQSFSVVRLTGPESIS